MHKHIDVPTLLKSLVVITGFLLMFYLADVLAFNYSDWKHLLPQQRFLNNLTWFSLRIGLIFLITPLLIRGNVLHAVGLDRRFVRGMALAFVQGHYHCAQHRLTVKVICKKQGFVNNKKVFWVNATSRGESLA